MQKILMVTAICALMCACASPGSSATNSQAATSQTAPPQAGPGRSGPPRSGPPPGGPVRISGTVAAVDGNTITVNSAEAASVDLRVTPATRFMFREPRTAKAINSESFIGCAAVEQEDGTLVASACHIFPEHMRGSGQGHRPMREPATTMTNGTVATMTNGTVEGEVDSANSFELTLSYDGGTKSIQITPETAITQIVPAGQDALVPGARVNGAVRQSEDGGADILFINIEN